MPLLSPHSDLTRPRVDDMGRGSGERPREPGRYEVQPESPLLLRGGDAIFDVLAGATALGRGSGRLLAFEFEGAWGEGHGLEGEYCG